MSSGDDERMDAEATAFALELLMPEEWIKRDTAGVDLFDDAKIAKIAKRYKVPPALMAFRLGQLQMVLA